MELKKSEKREYARVDFNVEAGVITNGYFFRDKVVDLSEGGAQLKVKNPWLVGRDMLLKIHLGPEMFTVYGDVRWISDDDHKMGVQFLYLSDGMQKLIRCINRNRNPEC